MFNGAQSYPHTDGMKKILSLLLYFPEDSISEEQSKKLGTKLVRHKGQRIFLDELPSDAKGYNLKNYDVECGVFCEVKWF